MLWGSIIIIIFCYLVDFRKTIEEMNILNDNRKLALKVSDAGKIRENLINELSGLESDVNTELPSEINKQEELLEIVSRKTSGGDVKIIEIPKQECIEETNFSLIYQAILVQGCFMDLLLFARAIEEDKRLGHICSADFYRYSDKKSGFSATRLKLYLQEIIPQKK